MKEKIKKGEIILESVIISLIQSIFIYFLLAGNFPISGWTSVLLTFMIWGFLLLPIEIALISTRVLIDRYNKE